MNEQKLIKVLKQLTILLNLQDEKNKQIDLRFDNLQEQINVITKRLETKVCHDEVNQLIEESDLTKSARIT